MLRESRREDILRDIEIKIEKLDPGEKVDRQCYLERLELCRNCDQLQAGVCMQCGCYVEFRAAFRKQKCPSVKGKKW